MTRHEGRQKVVSGLGSQRKKRTKNGRQRKGNEAKSEAIDSRERIDVTKETRERQRTTEMRTMQDPERKKERGLVSENEGEELNQ